MESVSANNFMAAAGTFIAGLGNKIKFEITGLL